MKLYFENLLYSICAVVVIALIVPIVLIIILTGAIVGTSYQDILTALEDE